MAGGFGVGAGSGTGCGVGLGAGAGTGVGEWLVVAVWGLVSLVLVALGFVITKLLPKLSPQRATA